MNLASLVLLSSVFLVACGKSDEPKPAPKPVEPAPATAGSATESMAGTEKTGGVPGSENLAPLAGLMAQLESEAKSRPAVKVTAERAFEAIKANGLQVVGEPQQVLGKTALAKYCVAARIEPAIGVSVCEYETAEQAKTGGEFMDKNFKGLAPDAVRVINGTTLLTVANATSHEDVRKRVLALFKSL